VLKKLTFIQTSIPQIRSAGNLKQTGKNVAMLEQETESTVLGGEDRDGELGFPAGLKPNHKLFQGVIIRWPGKL